MLERIEIENFRCIKQKIEVKFESDITLIVGENDAGKTTILDALAIFLNEKTIDEKDINVGMNEIILNLYTTEFQLMIKANKENLKKPYKEIIITEKYLIKLKEELDTIENPDDDFEKIKKIADYVSQKKTTNTSNEKYKASVIEKINKLIADPECLLESTILNLYGADFLDGKKIDNMNEYVNTTYVNDFKKNIWEKTVTDKEVTIKSFIDDEFNKEIERVSKELNSDKFISNVQRYNKEIKNFILKGNDIPLKTIDATTSVSMIDNNGSVIDIDKKGDGTKRRITMSLFELRAGSKSLFPNQLYVFDEPDTHLHVKAQCDLLETINNIKDRQIIITTHSPFLINSISIDKIRLINNDGSKVYVKMVRKEDDIDRCIENLGVENINIFFSKKIVLVEGETEEAFLKEYYRINYGVSERTKLIKIINIKGVQNSVGFARAIKEFKLDSCTIAMVDNDITGTSIEKIINELGLIEDKNYYKIGSKEFEDSFKVCDIYNSWSNYAGFSPTWNIKSIESLKKKCFEEGLKFSKELSKLTCGSGKGFTKPEFGRLLAKYTPKENLDSKIIKVLENL